ncbi:methyl-accepting chemotaxis protein [Geobacter sp.]|uniref:methyl-accepting chemotaxis protein n=1 Tax=Geobacter sp. TaxID=46610 RepID=UPI00262FB0DA|nr:methyl-accepting chemotaxis protein [Geobacter sp.]
MRVPIGYKFTLGFVVVVAAVAFVPTLVALLGYQPEIASILSYMVAMTVGLILGWFFSRGVARTIGVMTDSAEAISRGDLVRDVCLPAGYFPDETADLGASINRMVASLRELAGHIRGAAVKVAGSARTLSISAVEVNSATEEVAQAVEQIARGAGSQAEMVEKSSRIIHEMAISVELVARRARESARAAQETSQTARRGQELAQDSLDRMKSLFDRVEEGGRQFTSFNARLQQVGKIADFIAEIARQTNLLALNASIEAARAGEYGRGFAVVAEEVRKLADGTGKSAASIIELIETVRDESRRVQQLIEESSREIVEGKRTVDITAGAFREILTTALETERRAGSIADLSHIQTAGAEKMVKAVDEIARVAADNAAAGEEVSVATEEQATAMQDMTVAARELAELAEGLMQVVGQFSLPKPGAPLP